MRSFLCALLIAAASFAPQEAHAQKAAGDTYQIEVCNNTDQDVFFAIGYMPVGSNELRSEGWRTIRARTCSIQAETSNQYFYGYAEEVTGDGTWGGNFGHCVIRPGPFDFPMRGMCSRPGAAEIQMIELQADDSVYGGRFTWNLNY
jgi:uncharacterized membrane protein